MQTTILGVKIDKVTMDQALDQVIKWSKEDGKHFIVTPNIEFLMLAQKDSEFRKILNEADLSIPDSARLSWGYYQTQQKNLFLKLLIWPLFLMPKLMPVKYFDTVTGTDLMDNLIRKSIDQGFTIGFLGGQKKLAEQLKERLQKKYPSIKIPYASSDLKVDTSGEVEKSAQLSNSKLITHHSSLITLNSSLSLPPTDILFVALGQGKQEKWIYKNLKSQPVKVMIGVGGALDYLSGKVPRAPKILRQMGLEWLFRLILQPWRIKRFGALLKYIFLVLKTN